MSETGPSAWRAPGGSTGTRRLWSGLLAAMLVAANVGAAAQERVYRLGVLSWKDAGPYFEATHAGLMAGLKDGGLVEGQNLIVLRREADYDAKRFEANARELARVPVDAFFAPATPMATAAWRADKRTPIVIASIIDPVELEFVQSLARPGTRVTGVSTMNKELTGKRMQLLVQASGAQRIGVLVDDAMRHACKQEVDTLNAAAKALGVELTFVSIAGPDDIETAFQKLKGAGAQAVLTTLTSTRNGLEREYAEATLRHKLPSMSESDYGARLGALLSYGPDLYEVFRRAGHYVARVLKGEQPAQMAIEQPQRFRLSINLKTAKSLGIELPAQVRILADAVIE